MGHIKSKSLTQFSLCSKDNAGFVFKPCFCKSITSLAWYKYIIGFNCFGFCWRISTQELDNLCAVSQDTWCGDKRTTEEPVTFNSKKWNSPFSSQISKSGTPGDTQVSTLVKSNFLFSFFRFDFNVWKNWLSRFFGDLLGLFFFWCNIDEGSSISISYLL